LILPLQKKEGRQGVDPNVAEGEGGNTALHMAVGAAQVWNERLGDFEKCVTILASLPGIDLDCQNKKGSSRPLFSSFCLHAVLYHVVRSLFHGTTTLAPQHQ
jgi:hypothetical protein